ncbi:glycosyltransferase family 39 protein [Verrucomicrobiota bacterium sgz303538]
MASETKIQELVHKLEVGGWAKWIKLALLIAAISYVVILWFYRDNGFKGLSEAKAMEQAQIAREVARGNGFTTKMIRPAALWQFQKNEKNMQSVESFPDAYHAPLPIYVNAIAFKVMDGVNDLFSSLSQRGWKVFDTLIYEKEMTTKSIIYAYDKFVAFIQVVFFLLAVLMNYFIAKRLFDKRLALLGMGLMLLCDLFWQYSMSGLPQMLMLFLFSCAVYCLVRAVEAQVRVTTPVDPVFSNDIAGEEGGDLSDSVNVAASPSRLGRWDQPLPWLAGCAVLFGLLALAHGLTIWIFGGALLFVGLYFRPFGRAAAIMLALFLVVYSPWMVRNYRVCGSPVGLGWYSGLFQIRGTESAVMRSMSPPLEGVSPTTFRNKVQGQVLGQFETIVSHLGRVIVAPVFFIALLHLFRRRETGAFRWGVLLMWLAAVFGMAVFGLEKQGGIDANNLHVLFIPLLTFYGLAFILVMWSRLQINIRLLRIAFLTLIFFVSSLSFLITFVELHSAPQGRVQWPPYVPPYISLLGQWTTPREMITSDMPWAVAWYADRTSLWLPVSIKNFIELSDYKALQKPIVGLYLTPVSGNSEFIRDIVKGEYKEWAPFIMRNANIKNFPLRAVTALPIDQECVFYADRDRWTTRED